MTPDDRKSSGDVRVTQADSQQLPAVPCITSPDARLLALSAAMRCIIWTSIPDGTGSWAEWLAYTGQAAVAASGWDWLDAVHPDDRAQTRQVWSDLLANEKPVSFNIRMRLDGSDYRMMRVVGEPVRGNDGAVREWVGACLDVSVQYELAREQERLLAQERNARDEAQAAEARLRAVLDVLPIGVALADTDGSLTLMNKALFALWGDEAPSEGGIAGYDKYKAWWTETGQRLTSNDRTMARALRLRQPIAEDVVDIETFDGQRKTILSSASPVYDAHGTFTGAVAANVDITDRKRLEAELARRLSELEGVFGSITDAVFVYDADGHLIRLNAAARRLLGLSDDIEPDYAALSERERVKRNNLRRDTGAPLLDEEWVLTRLMRGEVITAENAVDVLLSQPNGVDALISFTGAPIRDGDGTIIGAVSVGRNVTERNRLESQLREANVQLAAVSAALAQQARDLETTNRRMDQFLGMANHEMKTPLTSLGANLQLATRRLRRLTRLANADASAQAHPASLAQAGHEAEAIITMLDRAQVSARRMTRLVNELLDVSRIQTGRLELHPEPCDVVALTRGVLSEMRQGRSGRVCRLETELTSAPVLADPDRLSEVIDNYLSNAVKYSPADTPITVSLALMDAKAVRVTVRDEGQGISPETQARIWNVFERLDSDATQRANGVNLGLGLHICKTIIELHGGEVGVESVLGAGSTFWFTLPLASPSA